MHREFFQWNECSVFTGRQDVCRRTQGYGGSINLVVKDRGLGIMDYGLYILDSGLWTLDSEIVEMKSRHS